MKILTALLIILLSGCTTTRVNVVDKNGVSWDISYTAWGRKDIQDVHAAVGNVTFDLGSSSQDTPTINNEVVACMLAPQLCK